MAKKKINYIKILSIFLILGGGIFLAGKYSGFFAVVLSGDITTGQGSWATGQLTVDFEVTDYDAETITGLIKLHSDNFFVGYGGKGVQTPLNTQPLNIEIYNKDTDETLHTVGIYRVATSKWEADTGLGEFALELNWNGWTCGQLPNPYNPNDPRDYLVACGGVSPNLVCKGYMAVINCNQDVVVNFQRRDADNIGFRASLIKEQWYFASLEEAEALQPSEKYVEYTTTTELEPIELVTETIEELEAVEEVIVEETPTGETTYLEPGGENLLKTRGKVQTDKPEVGLVDYIISGSMMLGGLVLWWRGRQ